MCIVWSALKVLLVIGMFSPDTHYSVTYVERQTANPQGCWWTKHPHLHRTVTRRRAATLRSDRSLALTWFENQQALTCIIRCKRLLKILWPCGQMAWKVIITWYLRICKKSIPETSGVDCVSPGEMRRVRSGQVRLITPQRAHANHRCADWSQNSIALTK